MSDKEGKAKVQTPVMRLLNHSLFEKDVYKDEKGREGTPCYKVELVYEGDPSSEEWEAFEAAIVAAAVEEWGDGAEDDYWDDKLRTPILDGDTLADDREARGKKGDAYRGTLVVRASTQFNRHGENGPGGVYACDENAEEVGFSERDKFYRGCYVVANVTPSAYKVQERGVTLYLNGVQFIKDGERIQGSDPSGLFSPMMGKDSGGKGRKARGRGKK